MNNRKKVTAVHKANIMKLGDGMFLKACRAVAPNFPTIKFEEVRFHVHALAWICACMPACTDHMCVFQ